MMRRNSIKFLQTFFCCSRVEDCFSSNEIQNFFSNPKDSYLWPAHLPIRDSILTKWVTTTITNTKQKSLKFGTVENGTKGAAEFVCQMTSKLGGKKFLWSRKRGHGGFGGLPVVFLRQSGTSTTLKQQTRTESMLCCCCGRQVFFSNLWPGQPRASLTGRAV